MGLIDNRFDENTIRDPWEHLARFYETTLMCIPADITEDQVKLRLFRFSLIGRAKDWLLFLQNGTIQTWKELKDKSTKKSLCQREECLRWKVCNELKRIVQDQG